MRPRLATLSFGKGSTLQALQVACHATVAATVVPGTIGDSENVRH